MKRVNDEKELMRVLDRPGFALFEWMTNRAFYQIFAKEFKKKVNIGKVKGEGLSVKCQGKDEWRIKNERRKDEG